MNIYIINTYLSTQFFTCTKKRRKKKVKHNEFTQSNVSTLFTKCSMIIS